MKNVNLNTLKNQFTNLFSKNDKIKMVPIESMRVDAEYQSLYKQEDDKVQRIADDMKTNGYDLSQPIIVLADNTIIDGHSRYLAAKQAGIKSVPVIYKEITERTDVLNYMEHLQLDRRNLTEAETIAHFENLMKLKAQAKSEGKPIENFTDEAVAKQLNISTRQVQKIREVEKKATPEQLEKIKSGTKTMAQVHAEIKSEEAPTRKSPERKISMSGIEKENTTPSASQSKTRKTIPLDFVLEILKTNLEESTFIKIAEMLQGE